MNVIRIAYSTVRTCGRLYGDLADLPTYVWNDVRIQVGPHEICIEFNQMTRGLEESFPASDRIRKS